MVVVGKFPPRVGDTSKAKLEKKTREKRMVPPWDHHRAVQARPRTNHRPPRLLLLALFSYTPQTVYAIYRNLNHNHKCNTNKYHITMTEDDPTPQQQLLRNLPDRAAYDAKIKEASTQNRIVVIKFYASWCRACKAMAPKFERVAQDWPEVEFCEILFDSNKKLAKNLGIKILPYIEIITGSAGKVEGFSCGPSKISKLQGMLEMHGGCEEIPCSDISSQLDMMPS